MAKATTSAPLSRAICATHGRRARTGAAAESGADKNHPRALQRLAHFVGRFVRRVVAQLGIAAGAESARDGPADLHFVCGDRAGERLHVGVDRDHFGVLHAVEHDAVERIRAGASDADDFDRESSSCLFRQAVIAAELDHRSLAFVRQQSLGLTIALVIPSRADERGTSQQRATPACERIRACEVLRSHRLRMTMRRCRQSHRIP